MMPGALADDQQHAAEQDADSGGEGPQPSGSGLHDAFPPFASRSGRPLHRSPASPDVLFIAAPVHHRLMEAHDLLVVLHDAVAEVALLFRRRLSTNDSRWP